MNLIEFISSVTGAKTIKKQEQIQTLWSGYGRILRYSLTGAPMKSVVVKHVQYDQNRQSEGISDKRKRHSYHVETAWYKNWSDSCDDYCPVPHCFGIEANEHGVIMVLEDLNETGFPLRKVRVTPGEADLCVKWLACFHALFLEEKPVGLWESGTYWHLQTRPEELNKLSDSRLKKAAPLIDQRLNETLYPTIVHGDAKLANFCFSKDSQRAAAVDFQYAGGGCGMKDLVYLMGSCYYYDQCEKHIPETLNNYFSHFREALNHYGKKQDPRLVEDNWRELFPYAWADFHRFLKGWTPGHWNKDDYSEKITHEIVEKCL